MKAILAGTLLLLSIFGTPGTGPIAGARGVASLERVKLNGAEQWILIRGEDRTKPVVLFLHGGPGMPLMYLAHAFRKPLERHFVVVHWDRRGAGKSLSAGEPSKIRVSQELADAVQLIDILRHRFGQRQVILVGHSYGSYLGMSLVQLRPDMIRAYVGVGQVACSRQETEAIQDAWLAGVARADHDEKVLTAARSGQPWDRENALFKYGGEVVAMKSFLGLISIGLQAPEYSLEDAINVKRGVAFTHSHFVDDGPGLPLISTITQVRTPVYFFTGRHDFTAPFNCADRYLNTLKAPSKAMVWFESSAHFPFLEEPEKFDREMQAVAAATQ